MRLLPAIFTLKHQILDSSRIAIRTFASPSAHGQKILQKLDQKGIVDSRYGRLRVAEKPTILCESISFPLHRISQEVDISKKLYGIALKSPLLKIIMVSDSVVQLDSCILIAINRHQPLSWKTPTSLRNYEVSSQSALRLNHHSRDHQSFEENKKLRAYYRIAYPKKTETRFKPRSQPMGTLAANKLKTDLRRN